MTHVKFLILGGGPSGLSFAHTLLSHGEDSFLVLEKESEAGGLCRSQQVNGFPLDIGGGHFLDVRREDALNLLFRFMPRTEWTQFSRIAKINLRGTQIDHPLEANLWQLPGEAQVDFLESIAQAGSVRGESSPESFENWTRWKFGERIAEEYMLPYNRKIWRMDLNRLGTYWLHKLPSVSFRETLQSCLLRKSCGSLPAHASFLYPNTHGYGEVWRRMGEALGDRLVNRIPVENIDIDCRVINGAFKGDVLVNTIPWPVWTKRAKPPDEISNAISRLVHIPIDVDFVPSHAPSDAHWIYEPDEKVSYHRILCRSNFCAGSKGGWTETNSNVSPPPKEFRHRNEYAYPVNTIDKPRAMQTICDWAASKSILPLGRWGLWEHVNSDVAVSLAIKAAKDFIQRQH